MNKDSKKRAQTHDLDSIDKSFHLFMLYCSHTYHTAPETTDEEFEAFMDYDRVWLAERSRSAHYKRICGGWVGGSDRRNGYSVSAYDSAFRAWQMAWEYPGTYWGCGNHYEIYPLFDNDSCFRRAIEQAEKDRQKGIDRVSLVGL